VADGATVFSTSTRNFDNRMGKDARVYLGSAELAAVCARLGRIPSLQEYLDAVQNKIEDHAEYIYRYLSFDQMEDYQPKKVIPIAEVM
jgi:aconitate hydratase 2/2-methylisocitrate dehydratase